MLWTGPAEGGRRLPFGDPAFLGHLSSAVLGVLACGAVYGCARGLDAGGPLAFPTARGKPLKDMALSGLLKDLEIAAVPHGFRSSFRDWAALDLAAGCG